MTSSNFNFDNKTLYGIQSEAGRYIWSGYFLLVITSSLIGDTIILIASIKYKAFKLHKMIVTIFQHIAVCDLLSAVGHVAPAMLSAIYDTGSCLLYTSPSPRDGLLSRMPSSA